LLRVHHRQDELGPALVLRGARRRDGPRRTARLRRLPPLRLLAPACCAHARARARRRRRSSGPPGAPARVGHDRRSRRHDCCELLLPDDAVLLFLRLPRAGARAPARLRGSALTSDVRRVVYTVLMGRYEPLLEQHVASHFDTDLVCFTDDGDASSATWEIRHVEPWL